ncbi:MAG: aldo/keto reductase [Puniceicoccaceae bacterium]
MKNPSNSSRRNFLKTSIAAPVAIAGAATGANAAPDKAEPDAVIPRRKLGRNGPEVTMVTIGGSMEAHSPQYLDLAWRNGIRSFDTSPNYLNGISERNVGGWNSKFKERRKELFLVTKEPAPGGPEEMISNINRRLDLCQTEYIDLLFMHGIGVGRHGKESVNWPKSDRFRKVVEKLKESGKAKLIGFSCHDDELLTYMNNAAEGGFLDAIMIKYNPFFEKGDAFDQAVQRVYDAGIGLICMKEMRPYAKAPKTSPEMEQVGLTTQQAVLHKVWSDKRISAICSMMENVSQIEENCNAARIFKKSLPAKQAKALQEIAMLNPVMMCPGCPSCREGAIHTDLAFSDISRYLTYYEQNGDATARERYRKLSAAQRMSSGADLAALREGCQYKVDYPEIIKRAEQYFG